MQIMTEKQQDLVQTEQVEHIAQLVEQRLDKRLAEFRVAAQSQAQGTGTLELELKHQRELMQQGFEHMNKRFEAVDKRFEAMDKRFEAVDRRFEEMRSDTNQRFEELRSDTNQRFEELRSDMNQRFEMLISSMDKRFETVDKRFAFMQWMMAAGFGLMGLMMSLYKFFP